MIEIRPQENSGDQGERKNGGTTVQKSPNGLSAGVAAALVSQGALTMTRQEASRNRVSHASLSRRS